MSRAPFMQKFIPRAKGPRVYIGELDAVIMNIESILNTKEGYGSFLSGFGLGGYTQIMGTTDLLAALAEEIRGSIETHEPRLRGVQLTLKGRDPALWLHYELTGALGDVTQKLNILFHTVSGRVHVEKKP